MKANLNLAKQKSFTDDFCQNDETSSMPEAYTLLLQINHRALTSTVLLVIMFCLSIIPVSAQSDSEKEQLVAIAKKLNRQGYSPTHDLFHSSLDDNEYTYFYYELHKGWKYTLTAVCDNDCDDLDLYLYDENGNNIDVDTSSDYLPVVNVSPRWTGRFKLKVKMYDCDIEPCGTTVAVFGK